MHNPFLIGSHIYLRPLERSDGPMLAPWLNDPEVNRTLRRCHPISLLDEDNYLAGLAGTENVHLGIALRRDDQLIGATGLHEINWRCRHTQFGIVVGDKSQWDKGHGTEATRLMVAHAFQTLNLNRVWLHVYEYNPRGIHAYEKVGFRKEGVLRQDTFREGRYWDTVVMAILREEWRAQ